MTLDELEKKLAEATGPSRELDRAIAEAVGYTVEVILVPPGHPVFKDGSGLEFKTSGDGIKTGITSWTSSIDAAVALCEAVLPGSEYEISTIYGESHVSLPLNSDDTANVHRRDCNVCLAFVTAIIRALKAEREKK